MTIKKTTRISLSRYRFGWQFLLPALVLSAAWAQTRIPSNVQSYLYPGDSLYYDLSLEKGDVLEWSLWLAAASPEAGTAALTLVSDVEGELWRRYFDASSAEVREEVKINRKANYRIVLKSDGRRGRVASLGVWAKLSAAHDAPFPPPAIQRIAATFSAGDKFTVAYEFIMPDTLAFSRLLSLVLPENLVYLWTVTAKGDSLAAKPSVQRWLGEAGKFSLWDRAPRGGRITLRLELDLPDDGDATVFVAPGLRPPSWLPAKARVYTEKHHDPWSVVIVPPISVMAESLATRPEDPPRAQYAAQSLRARGLDSLTVQRFASIYAERDSLAKIRRARAIVATDYDSLFLIGKRAFLPPEIHAAFTSPLSSEWPPKKQRRESSFAWFAESASGESPPVELCEWRYDEASFAAASLPEELMWDGEILPLNRVFRTHKIARPGTPAEIRLPPRDPQRPLAFERDGIKYLDFSRAVWGFYLRNTSRETVYLVYRYTRPVPRSPFSAFARWPLFAKVSVVVLGLFAVAGGAALIEGRRRERLRRKRAEEFAAELEKARQVQVKLIPPNPIEVRGLEVFGIHQSMTLVGGDYYDCFPLDDGSVIMCVADVAGHGMAAALLMSNLQASMRAVAQTGKPLNDMVAHLNREMFQRTSPEHFVTLLLARISADRSLLTVCNAGHNPGYLIRTNGNIVELDAGGIILGVVDAFPFFQMEFGLNRGDLLVFYTDGIPEAQIGDQDMFGYERLKHFLSENRGESLRTISRNLIAKVTGGEKDVEDDMALLMARITQ